MSTALLKEYSYWEIFWPVFSFIRTEYGDLQSKYPYSVRMRENMNRKKSENGNFPRSATCASEEKKYSLDSFVKKDYLQWKNILQQEDKNLGDECLTDSN